MKFRKATKDDLTVIGELVYQLNLFHDEDIRPDIQSYHDNWDSFDLYLVEDSSGDIVGFLSGYDSYQFHTGIKRYEIQNLFVAESARRKGVAKLLFDETIAIKRATGTTQFSLGVLDFNEGAIQFYEEYGFELATHKARRYKLKFPK